MLKVAVTVDQELIGSRVGLDSRTKLVSCTGQEMRTTFPDKSPAVRRGSGSTNVVMLAVLLPGAGSE